jgi:probable addiction module antidote protein
VLEHCEGVRIGVDGYDTADYLVDLDDAAAFLEAALEESGEDPAYIAQALGTIARSGNVSELARRVGMSREGLYVHLSRGRR